MKFVKRVIVLCYMTLVLFIGCCLILFVMNRVSFDAIVDVLSLIYSDPKLKIIFGVFGGILLFTNYIFFRIFSISIHREKIIAFDNPNGRISVSLTAIEDMIKRKVLGLAEVKEIKADITASKKGIQIKIRLILNAEVNIPEMTSRVQDLVKDKIQDTIGIDEAIRISIHIGKIFSAQIKPKKVQEAVEKEQDDAQEHPQIPFQGYRP